MSEPTDDGDIAERTKALNLREAAAGGPQALVESLVKGVHRQGRFLKWVAISVVFDIVLSIILGFAVLQINHNAYAVHLTCLSGNTFRANERALWDFVFQLPANPNETSAEKAFRESQTDKFTAFLDKTFAPRTCK